VAKCQHALLFILRKIPSYDLIRTIFEEIWFFLKEKPYLSEKMMSILTRPIGRYLPSSKIVHNIYTSLHIARMCSSGKSSFIGVISTGALGIRDK